LALFGKLLNDISRFFPSKLSPFTLSDIGLRREGWSPWHRRKGHESDTILRKHQWITKLQSKNRKRRIAAIRNGHHLSNNLLMVAIINISDSRSSVLSLIFIAT
jgi:hypothetical protein